MGVSRPKGLNIIAVIGYGYLCLRVIDLSYDKLHYSWTVNVNVNINISNKPCQYDALYIQFWHLGDLFILTTKTVNWFTCWSEEFENTNGLIRSCKQKKHGQYNGQKKNKRQNDLQNTTQKTKKWATRTPLTTEDVFRFTGIVSSSCSTCGTRRVTLVTDSVTSHALILNLLELLIFLLPE